MAQLTIEQAQRELFSMLNAEDMGDRIYEFAQNLFERYVNLIECADKIDTDMLESDEAWYDDAREEFFQAVYDRAKNFLTNED